MEIELTNETEIIIPISENLSKIVDNGKISFVNKNPIDIISYSCEYFGCTYEGRRFGTKLLLGVDHKLPILVEESKKIIFFPTKSPKNKDCIWINLSTIKEYCKNDNKISSITFKNGDTININVPYYILNNQILRSSRLKIILEERSSSFYNKIESKKEN